jgi:urease accessory protein
MLLLSGGFLDGDQASMEVIVEPGARLALRTQAASQVHAGASSQMLHATVGVAGSFSYMPHAVVPHANADHHITTSVQMQPGARVLLAESLSPGRVEHGELFLYRRLQTNLNVWCGSKLVARERVRISPDLALRCAQFGRFTHTAAVYALGPGDAPRVEDSTGVQLGRSELAQGGWYIRAMSQRAADLDSALEQLSTAWWRSCDVHKSGG